MISKNTNTMNSGQNSELEIFNIQQLFKVFKIITKLLQFLYIGPQIKKDILVFCYKELWASYTYEIRMFGS